MDNISISFTKINIIFFHLLLKAFIFIFAAVLLESARYFKVPGKIIPGK